MGSREITTKPSSLPVTETVRRLTDAITAAGAKVFALIDQRAEAQAAGLELRETQLIIFGNPAAGTAVMQAAPLAALDLPLKILVWSEGQQTMLAYTSPAALAARYELGAELARVLGAPDAITEAALRP